MQRTITIEHRGDHDPAPGALEAALAEKDLPADGYEVVRTENRAGYETKFVLSFPDPVPETVSPEGKIPAKK